MWNVSVKRSNVLGYTSDETYTYVAEQIEPILKDICMDQFFFMRVQNLKWKW